MYSRFEGDNDQNLMLIQHDCYWSSTLSLMLQIIEKNLSQLRSTHPNLPSSIDHRTIQDAHDLLAAAFRYNFKNSSGYKKHSEDTFFGLAHHSVRQKTQNEIISEWHCWLAEALEGENEIISEFQTVWLNQNVATGYEAEDNLRGLIIQKFSHIKWCHSDLEREPWSPVDLKMKTVDEKIQNKNIIEHLQNPGATQPNKIDIFKAELDEIHRSKKLLEDNGVNDEYTPPEYIDWMPDAFYENRSGWSKVYRYDYKWRKQQLEKCLPEGAGCCYVLGVLNEPNLSKIGFTSISAYDRALDYGKEYDLKFFVYDIIPSKNAAALEKRAHEGFKSYHYNHLGSKEIFSIDPVTASRQIRQLEPNVEDAFLQREMQWLSLREILTNVKIAKEQWQLVSKVREELEHEKRISVALGKAWALRQ